MNINRNLLSLNTQSTSIIQSETLSLFVVVGSLVIIFVIIIIIIKSIESKCKNVGPKETQVPTHTYTQINF